VTLFSQSDGPTRVLVLAPHTDDAELGAGATISRLGREGAEVHIVAFSAAELSVPKELPPDINREDAVRSAGELGVPADRVRVLEFPVRRFPEHRQEILETMIRLRTEIDPDVVFGPCSTDRHQDHSVVNDEMLRAYGRKTLLGYELPWNCINFEASSHVEVTDDDLKAKVHALSLYRSQESRNYMSDEFCRSWAYTRGIQSAMELSESFEMIHWRAAL